MVSGRKWHRIDIMALYTKCRQQEWNNFLTACVAREDILILEKTYYGIQAGMDQLVKERLNSEKIINWYLRLGKSIEITVKRIYRSKYPSVLDDPIAAQGLKTLGSNEYFKQLKIKRDRDQAYEKWLRRVAF